LRYDLPDLRLVAAIADSGSLTRAADLVHLAPSSASHRLTQLEAALGVPLFARHARGLTATAAGESLLRHARQVFAQLEQMHADLTPYASGRRPLRPPRGEGQGAGTCSGRLTVSAAPCAKASSETNDGFSSVLLTRVS
jgi:molybdenum-dependent DNA-binding transcriptional regulator ModE